MKRIDIAKHYYQCTVAEIYEAIFVDCWYQKEKKNKIMEDNWLLNVTNTEHLVIRELC